MAGILGSLSGVWITLAHQELTGPILFYARILFGTLWIVFILAAIRAILVRDIARHRANMIRAYAIAANAGTIAFVYIPIMLIMGDTGPFIEENTQVLGWFINLAVAEWIIRRRPREQRLSTQIPQSA